MKKRAVFLDRDGVLNTAIVKDGKPYPPGNVDEIQIPAGVSVGMHRLRNAGFVLIVVTNQPDVGRGIATIETVEAINEYLANWMPVDRFIMCYHDNTDGCECRKPLPGMLLTGAREFDIDLASSYMVGDRWRDVEAGLSAGCKTIFIDYGYHEKQPNVFDFKVTKFTDAVSIILNETTNEKS